MEHKASFKDMRKWSNPSFYSLYFYVFLLLSPFLTSSLAQHTFFYWWLSCVSSSYTLSTFVSLCIFLFFISFFPLSCFDSSWITYWKMPLPPTHTYTKTHKRPSKRTSVYCVYSLHFASVLVCISKCEFGDSETSVHFLLWTVTLKFYIEKAVLQLQSL